MPKWDIFNTLLLLNEHGHKRSHMINIQWIKFKQKSIDSFISGELPQAIPLKDFTMVTMVTFTLPL